MVSCPVRVQRGTRQSSALLMRGARTNGEVYSATEASGGKSTFGGGYRRPRQDLIERTGEYYSAKMERTTCASAPRTTSNRSGNKYAWHHRLVKARDTDQDNVDHCHCASVKERTTLQIDAFVSLRTLESAQPIVGER